MCVILHELMEGKVVKINQIVRKNTILNIYFSLGHSKYFEKIQWKIYNAKRRGTWLKQSKMTISTDSLYVTITMAQCRVKTYLHRWKPKYYDPVDYS